MRNLYKILLAALLTVVTLSAHAAETVTIDGIIYEASSDGTYASVTSVSTSITSANIQASVQIGGKDLPVTTISTWAFSDLKRLTSVEIPNSVTTIDGYAFWYCTGLTSVEIPNSVISIGNCAFQGCTGLTSVEIPNSVSSIGGSAFYDCTGLTSIEIPTSVSSIGAWAFRYCTGLTSVEIGNSVTSIGSDAFSGCKNLTKVIYKAVNCVYDDLGGCFIDCISLKEIEIGEDVKKITGSIFYNIPSLTKLIFNAVDCSSIDSSVFTRSSEYIKEIEIGENVKTIPENAFRQTAITTIHIPNSVTTIGPQAFYNCSSLTNITIPNSVTTIGKEALWKCSGLTSITIPSPITTIGEKALYYCTNLKKLIYNAVNCSGGGFSKNNNWLYGCTAMDEVEIGESVKYLPDDTFYNCNSLTSVSTPSIEAWTGISFGNEYANPTYYAKKLLVNGETIRRLTLPEGLTELSRYAFVNCEPLVTVNCGSNIVKAGDGAFSGCTGLQRIYFDELKDFLQINYESEKALLTYGNDAVVYVDDSPIDKTKISWPESLTEIPDYAFYGEKLTSFDIPSTVVSIGKYAFAKTQLSEVILPANLQKLGDGAFQETKLTTITIPRKITAIGNETFKNCTSLTIVSFPEGLESIGNSTFENCTLLESLLFPASLESIGSDAFKICFRLYQVEIEDVNRWAQIQFDNEYSNPIYYAKKFKKSDMDEPIHKLDLKDIDEVSAYAFVNASCLNTVRIDCDVVGANAFKGCDNVTDLCIDASEIEDSAFGGMTGLKALYSLTSTPPAAPDNAFSKYTDVKLYVPRGAVSAYENAETCWWRFLDVYESDFSDMDRLFAPDYVDAVDDVAVDNAAKVYSANGCICVETPDASARVAVYGVNGAVMYVGAGNTRLETAPGLYIVNVNGRATKLAVK